ncbi:MAG TPA: hypothetical protein PKD83_07015 [Ignavibacteria bacterium]|nr:hypothetical protein [Ignavibacteria bacterium]
MKKSFLFLKYAAVLCLMLSIYVTGCDNKSEDVTINKKEEKTESRTTIEKNEIKNETKNETSLTNEEELAKKEEANQDPSQTSENKANELGMTPGLPKNFPADIPQPKNSKTLGSINSSDGTIVTFESPDKVLDIVSFYKDQMKKVGYTLTETGETLVSEKGGLINWTKDKKEVGLTLGYDKDRNITSIALTYN